MFEDLFGISITRITVISLLSTFLFGYGIYSILFRVVLYAQNAAGWILSIFNIRRVRFAVSEKEKNKSEINYMQIAADRIRIKLRMPSGLMPAVVILSGGAYLFSSNLLSLAPVAMFFIGRRWYEGIVKGQERKDVWLFLLDLRTRISLTGSLLTALRSLAADGQTITARILRIYLNAGYTTNGIAILNMIATDVELPFLSDLVSRAQASISGSITMDSAIRDSITAIQAEVNYKIREDLQSVPSRLVMFVFPSLLAPMLIMLLYPIVSKVISSLQGGLL